MLLSSHHIKDTYYEYDITVDAGYLAEVMSVRLLNDKVTILFLPFHTVLFGRKSLCATHT